MEKYSPITFGANKMDVESGPRPASVGQYGPTSPGRCGIDGKYGNVYSVTYEASMCGSASIPTSRPNFANPQASLIFYPRLS